MVNIGDMRHYVIVEKLREVEQNTYGEETQDWGSLSVHWAQITPLSGNELMTARQLNAEVTYRFDMWYDSAIKTQYRIKHGDRYFYILSVVNVGEESQFMQILAVEKAG